MVREEACWLDAGSGFGVWGLECGVWVFLFLVSDLRFGVWRLAFGVWVSILLLQGDEVPQMADRIVEPEDQVSDYYSEIMVSIFGVYSRIRCCKVGEGQPAGRSRYQCVRANLIWRSPTVPLVQTWKHSDRPLLEQRHSK